MTDRRIGAARRRVALVTTGIVSLGAAAAVGWAAAVPIGGAATPTSGSNNTAATTQTSQQIDGARANLQLVRRDLARLTAREDDMPRAKLANLSNLIAQLPSVQVPQSTSQPTVIHVTAPATHTTTGASGAGP